MNELRVRDHNKPCRHGWFAEHDSLETGFCPGGKEIVLQVKACEICWNGCERCGQSGEVYVEVKE